MIDVIAEIRATLDAHLGPNSDDWENDDCYSACHEVAELVGYPVDRDPEEET